MRAFILSICLIVVSGFAWPSVADAYTGRRAVLYTRGEAMLASNLPWIKQDCSLAAWRMIEGLWPEMKLTKWFRRTTADAMAQWPWRALMRLEDAQFGDLLFTGEPRIDHVLVHWDQKETAVHAAKSKGFSKTRLRPYWRPRIVLGVRPPY